MEIHGTSSAPHLEVISDVQRNQEVAGSNEVTLSGEATAIGYNQLVSTAIYRLHSARP